MTAWLRTDDRWLAWDKAAHAGLAGLLWLAVAGGYGTAIAWAVALAAGVVVEVVELDNYRTWERAGFPGRPGFWPYLTDLISWRDFLADVAGTALAHLLREALR